MRSPRRKWIPFIVLGTALLLTSSVTFYLNATIDSRDSSRFLTTVQRTASSIDNRISTYIALLRAGTGLFAADSNVDAAMFSAFVGRIHLHHHYPGALGVGYAPQISRDQGDTLSIFPDGDRTQYVPVLYLEPVDERNSRALGYDMWSDTERRSAMELARDSAAPAMTGRVRLIVEVSPDTQAGFLIYVPVYRTDSIPPTVAERRAALQGFLFSPFRTGDLLWGIAGIQDNPYVHLNVYDGSGIDRERLLYRSDLGDEETEPEYTPRLSTQQKISIAGRTWTLEFTSRPHFEAVSDKDMVPLIGIGGILFSFGLFLVTRMQARARTQVENIAIDLDDVRREVETLNRDLERRVTERTAELEISNRELEAFAYSVSHDLRAPLRSIDGFSKALLDDYGSVFDDVGRDYLNRVRTASQRMGDLIDDLLELSRVTRTEMQRKSVNLSDVARDIVEERRRHDPERQADILIADDIIADGDPRLLRIALENLFDNAWKFTANKTPARIEFQSVEQEGEQVFMIRDNGAGFNMKYADKLFDSFKRLHAPSQYPGNGIGLATVLRVIDRHGGRIWAEAEEEKGATFYFTLSNG